MADPYGTHRSSSPRGVLPRQADRLDVSMPLCEDEIEISVEQLNIDSASWTQIRGACDSDPAAMETMVLEIISTRGKMQNPVTGSGGMLVGTVSAVGTHRSDVSVGERIASLVSLSLTPLEIAEVIDLRPDSEQITVRGRAILFGSGNYARLPKDMDTSVALKVLDVCGAPAWAARLVTPAMRVAIIGAGGKSGLLAAAQAHRDVGQEGQVLGLCWPPGSANIVRALGVEAVAVDCTDPLAVLRAVTESFDGRAADLVIVCANVPGCEGGAILACEDDGRVLFFSMATSFSAAALSAEGLGKTCEMTIGNGYVPGHADLALDLVREDPRLLQGFQT